jgi:hypothetical protein
LQKRAELGCVGGSQELKTALKGRFSNDFPMAKIRAHGDEQRAALALLALSFQSER